MARFLIPGTYSSIKVLGTFPGRTKVVAASSSALPPAPGNGNGGGGGGGGGGVGPFAAGCPPFAVDIVTGLSSPGTVYGPSDGVTPITITYAGLTVDPSAGMLGYPPAGAYYVILGPRPGIAWYDATGAVAGGFTSGCAPGLWSGQCYGGAHLQGNPADPTTWHCALAF